MAKTKLWEVIEVYGDVFYDTDFERTGEESKYLQCTEDDLKVMIKKHRQKVLEDQTKRFIDDLNLAEEKLKAFMVEGGKKRLRKSLENKVKVKMMLLTNVKNTQRAKKSYYYREIKLSKNLN